MNSIVRPINTERYKRSSISAKVQTQNICQVTNRAARLATALLTQTDYLQHNC
jgi:hypothetical protein